MKHAATLVLLTTTLLGQELPSPQVETLPPSLPPLPLEHPQKNPLWAGVLSYVIPGTGQYYLGDMRGGSTLFGAFAVGEAGVFAGERKDSEEIFLAGYEIVNVTQGYGAYSAYRDARHYNGLEKYPYPMPQDTFRQVALAPFSWQVLRKPTVWGGLLGALALAYTSEYIEQTFLSAQKSSLLAKTASEESPLYPLVAFPTGISEECEFRGFIQSAFMDKMPPPAAITLSSLLFGAAHIRNAEVFFPDKQDRWRYYVFALPLITGFGGYFGWMTHHYHSLQEAVALHAWYDFVLMSSAYIGAKAAMTRGKEISYSFGWEF